MEFNINDLVTPVVLEYLEQGSTEQTINCLLSSGFKQGNILQVSREGVGSISKAFNKVFEGHLGFDVVSTKFIWWLSNVTFDPDVPNEMVKTMMQPGWERVGMIHPSFNSDHPFLRGCEKPYFPVSFCEFTAPMIRIDALKEVGLLDEDMPYFGMDIDLSARMKEKKWDCAVSNCRINHVYLYHSQPEPISKIRFALRQLYIQSTYKKLVDKWGEDWRNKICKKGNC